MKVWWLEPLCALNWLQSSKTRVTCKNIFSFASLSFRPDHFSQLTWWNGKCWNIHKYCIVLHQFCINYCYNFNWFWSFFIWNNWGCLPLKKVEFVFHFQKYWGHLTFSKEMRPYFIKQIRLSSIFIKIEVVFHLRKKLRLSSIYIPIATTQLTKRNKTIWLEWYYYR